jgi:hypothetical protein
MLITQHIIILINIIILAFLTWLYLKKEDRKRKSEALIKVLNSSIKFLDNLYKNKEIIYIKHALQLYSKFQQILLVSKSNYINFFKYDYFQKSVILHFILSLDDKGIIVQKNMFDNIPLENDLLSIDLLKSDDSDLHSLYSTDLEYKYENIYKIIKKYNINKIYYQNIYKEKDKPFGFILLSYCDDHTMSSEEKSEILKIIENIKEFI